MLPFENTMRVVSCCIKPKCLLFALLVIVAQVSGCGGNKLRANLTTEERLEYAVKLFSDHDYLDARTHFRIITLNAPGSAVVDRAQFYLAECHFHMEEFIIAAAEYEKVLRLYPRSEYLDDAQHKIALCYFELSPKADLDQKYTERAVEEFQKFLEDYPASELKEQASQKLEELRNKLAKKEYNSADLYRRLSYFESALVYYDEVLNRYYDTIYAEPSLYYKAEILSKLLRYSQAKEAIYLLMDRYRKEALKQPEESRGKSASGKYQSRAEGLLKTIETELGTNGSARK
ncbi:MAG: outer membrane protein assembly factor BamD [bacterium]